MEITGSVVRSRSRSSVSPWRWLAALSIVGNIALNYWANTHPFNGQTMGAVSAQYPTLLTPAGYAFSIWGLIFLALAGYGVWQLLPAQRNMYVAGHIARPLAVANVATAAWVVLFAYELIEISTLVMLVILGSLITVYSRARRLVLERKAPRWSSIPFSLYLGWISVATVINVTIGLQQHLWRAETGISVMLTLLLLAAVVGLALAISSAARDMVFPLVVAWALVGIWVARQGQYPELRWAALGGAGIAAVAGGALSLRKESRRERKAREADNY
ncbi:tryptophan-rich sensory protein [Hymenobacter cellulosivorans]|uniref:Tryptophan-rich sensory protein n=1 Tax=Hymenobacter cellulosivorans TaxID=2932249 RepID=A0ABY4FF18_9BACT|nr:tryptophan-rich sensory protein [Hymenobacter cellulosivorans]UOQ54603.1 tryptophan-rich sensory protein [Hymenobacter cellulosivorans]